MNKPAISSWFCSAFTGVLAVSTAAELETQSQPVHEDDPIAKITFVVVDTETTGRNERDGRVIEIGAVKICDGKVLAKKSWLINPGIPITADSQSIHGISDAMVADSPSFREVFSKFSAFIKNSVILAHNAAFDIRFLSAEIERNGLAFPENDILDTLQLARMWFPDMKSHSLGRLASSLNIKSGRLHRALSDAECTGHVFKRGVDTMGADATLKDLQKKAGKTRSFTNKTQISTSSGKDHIE